MEAVTAGWENFFVAEVGASAALTGLLFVAVSINLTRILSLPHLPSRAGETLVVLLSVLVFGTLGLVPRVTSLTLGVELCVLWAAVWAIVSVLQWRSRVPDDPYHQSRLRILTSQLPTLPVLLCGVSLILGHESALQWLVAATILTFLGGALNAWVLLVEINR